MAEIFRQTIPTRSGMFEKQSILTFVLVYALCIVLLLFVAGYGVKYGFQNWLPQVIGLLTIVFVIIFIFNFLRTPKELELVITSENLHAYNDFGFKKGYIDMAWNEILEIRAIDQKYHWTEIGGPRTVFVGNEPHPSPVPVIQDTSNYLIDVEQKILAPQESRILGYAVVTSKTIYVFELDSRNEKDFVEKVKGLGKYNPNPMNWDEVWQKKGGPLYFLKGR